MKYIVLDTCILKSSLVGKSSYSKDLAQIFEWHKKQRITLLCHDVLLDEWEKHKQDERLKIEHAIKNHTRQIEVLNLYNLADVLSGEENAKKILQEQIDDIDILLKESLRFQTPDAVNTIIIEHQRKGLPPFHVKRESLNDAILIFSALSYVESKSISEIFFVTNNHTDFGDIVDPQKIINSEITKYFQNVNVKYFTKSRDLITNLIELGLPRLNNAISSQTVSTFNKKNKVFSTNDHFVEQLECFIKIIYEDLNFIPLHALINHYPFATDENSDYDNYTLYSFNHEIFKFFNSFEVIEQKDITIKKTHYFKGVIKPKIKVKEIVKRLTSNLIYNIDIHGSFHNIRLFERDKCTCARCEIEKFHFNDLNFSKEVKETEIENLMNRAYAHYKVGHFIKAVELFQQVEEKSSKCNRNLSKYIAKYNLAYLASLIERHYFNNQEAQEIAAQLRTINLSEELCGASSAFDREIIEWMNNDNFLEYFSARLCKLRKLVVEHYENTQKGGTGSNNYINQLSDLFVEMDQFVQQNYIISDCYEPYIEMVEMFAEGLFASFSVKGDQNSKILSLNDWSLSIILKNARPRTIRKLIRQYKLTSVEYYNQQSDEFNIQTLITNLFTDTDEKIQNITDSDFGEPNYNFIQEKYQQWQSNALQLLRVMNFEESFIQQITDAILISYPSQKIPLDVYDLGDFLSAKDKYMTDEQLRKFFMIGVTDKNIQGSFYWQVMAKVYEQHPLKIKLTKPELSAILNIEITRRNPASAFVDIYRCLSDKQQKESIKEHIEGILKSTFDFDLWNLIVLYDILDFNSRYLEKAIKHLTPIDLSGTPIRRVPHGRPNYNSDLNDFINLCFKNDINLKDEKFNAIEKGQTEYYQWLFDLDNFDYTEFDTEWIGAYRSKFYYQRFRQCKVLKEYLETSIKELGVSSSAKLKEKYVDIYIA